MLFLLVQRPPPVLDALGRVISEAPPDQWEARWVPVSVIPSCFFVKIISVRTTVSTSELIFTFSINNILENKTDDKTSGVFEKETSPVFPHTSPSGVASRWL